MSIDFVTVNRHALRNAEALVSALLPIGRREGSLWVAVNPGCRDADSRSLRVSLKTGRWRDVTTADEGGDLISLAAHTLRLPERSAAICVAGSLGIGPFPGPELPGDVPTLTVRHALAVLCGAASFEDPPFELAEALAIYWRERR